jgi:hypothetical protein
MGVPLATVSKCAKFESPDPFYWCYKGYAVANVDDQVAMAKMYPDMNAYWNDKRADVGKVKIPVYQTAGWSHFHLPGSFNAWRRCRSHLKWMRAHRDFGWPDTYNPENHGTHNIHIGGEWESWIEVPVVPPRYQPGEYIHR